MIDEKIAHITCPCTTQIQVTNQSGDDWNESATATLYIQHIAGCTNAQTGTSGGTGTGGGETEPPPPGDNPPPPPPDGQS